MSRASASKSVPVYTKSHVTVPLDRPNWMVESEDVGWYVLCPTNDYLGKGIYGPFKRKKDAGVEYNRLVSHNCVAMVVKGRMSMCSPIMWVHDARMACEDFIKNPLCKNFPAVKRAFNALYGVMTERLFVGDDNYIRCGYSTNEECDRCPFSPAGLYNTQEFCKKYRSSNSTVTNTCSVGMLHRAMSGNTLSKKDLPLFTLCLSEMLVALEEMEKNKADGFNLFYRELKEY